MGICALYELRLLCASYVRVLGQVAVSDIYLCGPRAWASTVVHGIDLM